MWERDRVNAQGSVEKLSQNALFSNFAPKIYNRGKFMVEKYAIKSLPTI